MRCSIIIIRHGKTTWNDPKTKTFTGWYDVGLSDEGKHQAALVAKNLSKRKFSEGYCSSLKRGKDTLKICLSYHPKARIIVDNRIIERSYGDLSGKLHADIEEKFGTDQYRLWHRGYDANIPGGESIKEVERRTFSFATDLLSSLIKKPRNVVISGHNNSLRALRTFFEGFTVNQEMAVENPQDDYVEYSFDTTKKVIKTIRGVTIGKEVLFWTGDKKVRLFKP